MVTHFEYDENILDEIIAGVRTHWDGIFQFGAPDGVVKKGKEKKKQNNPVKGPKTKKTERSIQNLDHAVVRADS